MERSLVRQTRADRVETLLSKPRRRSHGRAKRYRVDTEKLQEAVAEELAAKRDKKTKATSKRRLARWQPESIHVKISGGVLGLHSATF